MEVKAVAALGTSAAGCRKLRAPVWFCLISGENQFSEIKFAFVREILGLILILVEFHF